MTVEELIDQLSTYPGTMPVIQAIDPEGNGYYPNTELGTGLFVDGELYNEDEDGIPRGSRAVVVLWPTPTTDEIARQIAQDAL